MLYIKRAGVVHPCVRERTEKRHSLFWKASHHLELTTAFTKFFILGTQYLDRVRPTTNARVHIRTVGLSDVVHHTANCRRPLRGRMP